MTPTPAQQQALQDLRKRAEVFVAAAPRLRNVYERAFKGLHDTLLVAPDQQPLHNDEAVLTAFRHLQDANEAYLAAEKTAKGLLTVIAASETVIAAAPETAGLEPAANDDAQQDVKGLGRLNAGVSVNPDGSLNFGPGPRLKN